MISILLPMVDGAQTSVLSQVLSLVWNTIGIKGPRDCESELMVVL